MSIIGKKTSIFRNDELLQTTQEDNNIVNDIAYCLRIDTRTAEETVKKTHVDYPLADGESFIIALYRDKMIREEAMKLIISYVKKEELCVKEDLENLFPYHVNNTTIIDELLIELEQGKKISIQNKKITLQYPTVEDYTKTITNPMIADVFIKVLQGEDIRTACDGLSSASARLARSYYELFLQSRPRLCEDKFRYLFDTYKISKEEFCLSFPKEPDATYRYLEVTSITKDKLRLSMALIDPQISVYDKEQLSRAINKRYVVIKGTHLYKDLDSIVRYVVRTECVKDISIETFKKKYNELIEELDCSNDEELNIDGRELEKYLKEQDYVLWKDTWRTFRYYNTIEYEYFDLINRISIERYLDQEISTVKLFDSSSDIMKQFDIRDSIELYDLLMKIWPSYGTCKVSFLRCPIINVGAGNHFKQVYELMVMNAPITQYELCDLYESTYGVKSGTVQNSYLCNIKKYLHHGTYETNDNVLSLRQIELLRTKLDKKLYSNEHLQRIYAEVFPKESIDKLNGETIRQVGYITTNLGCVIKNEYASFEDYFQSLFSKDVIDTRQFEKELTSISLYKRMLEEIKEKQDVIEFLPDQYISIRRLKENGITKTTISDYKDAVLRWCSRGTFFTIESLHKTGFTTSLDEYGFDDWFFSSILIQDKKDISYVKSGGNRLLYTGGSRTALLVGLIENMVGQKKKDIYDLQDELQNIYGINLTRSRIIEVIKNAQTELYYDSIMEAIYSDYETYFEEV